MVTITLISACLLGVRCRWDGEQLAESFAPDPETLYIPFCPEQLGGLPTPRPRCRIVGGAGEEVLTGCARVLEVESGEDRTDAFLRGARETLRIARRTGAGRALLKQRSPSCGCGEIYHDDELGPGNGVTTALLRAEGIVVSPLP